MQSDEAAREYAKEYLQVTKESLSGGYIEQGLAELVPLFRKAREEGRTIYFFGNGGSASTGSHMATDISKCTIKEPLRRYRCVSLADPIPTMLAWANDVSYAEIFSEQLKNMGDKGDVAVGISGSGNSPNVIRALETARKMGMSTVGLIGSGGGKMRPHCDVAIVVPSHDMQHIEDTHLLIGHLLTAYLRDRA